MMRPCGPFPPHQVGGAVAVASVMPRVHGAPVHIRDLSAAGIQDIARPDYRDAVDIRPGAVPVLVVRNNAAGGGDAYKARVAVGE